MLVVILMAALALRGVQKAVGDTVTVEQLQATEILVPREQDARVGQTFFVDYRGLSAVAVKLTTEGQPGSAAVVFHLQASGQVLLTRTLAVKSLVDEAYYTFEFDPLSDLVEQDAYFYLEQSDVEAGKGLAVWATEDDAYSEGELVLSGFESADVQDLAFRLTYQPSLFEKVGILARRLTEDKPSLWGDVRLYVLIGGLYLGMVYLLIVNVLAFSEYST